LAKGVDQLMDEGVAQLFTLTMNGRKIIGCVGQLQFEVIEYRLLHEYNAKCRYEPAQLYKACWVRPNDKAEWEDFQKRKYKSLAKDKHGRDVYLAESSYDLEMAQMKFKSLEFFFTSEF
jgi:peptide chain release factor 3